MARKIAPSCVSMNTHEWVRQSNEQDVPPTGCGDDHPTPGEVHRDPTPKPARTIWTRSTSSSACRGSRSARASRSTACRRAGWRTARHQAAVAARLVHVAHGPAAQRADGRAEGEVPEHGKPWRRQPRSSAMGKVMTTPNDPEVVLCGVRRFFDVAQEERSRGGLPPEVSLIKVARPTSEVCYDRFGDPLTTTRILSSAQASKKT